MGFNKISKEDIDKAERENIAINRALQADKVRMITLFKNMKDYNPDELKKIYCEIAKELGFSKHPLIRTQTIWLEIGVVKMCLN